MMFKMGSYSKKLKRLIYSKLNCFQDLQKEHTKEICGYEDSTLMPLLTKYIFIKIDTEHQIWTR